MAVLTAKVISIDDEFDGGRIKARIVPDDSRVTDANLPYAFPLLPKTFHVLPKVGESVLILTADDNNNRSQRYYIGPIISQPQFINKDIAEHSSSLLRGGMATESQAPSTSPSSIGAYPTTEDVSMVGRRNSEIILRETDETNKSSEIDIRCGVRQDQDKGEPAVFNDTHPAYIQVKYNPNGLTDEKNDGNGAVTIMADQVNLISPMSNDPSIKPSSKPTEANKNASMIDDETMKKLIDTAHQLPYGDILVDFLQAFRDAFNKHTHAWSTDTPCTDESYMKLNNFNLNSLLSKNIRIN